MATKRNIRAFSVDLRIILGVIFSLMAIGSMSASASYAPCDGIKDCFVQQMRPMNELAADEVHGHGSFGVDSLSATPLGNDRAPDHPVATGIPAPQSVYFYVPQSQGNNTNFPESLLLLVFFGALLAVMLVRAKSFNGK